MGNECLKHATATTTAKVTCSGILQSLGTAVYKSKLLVTAAITCIYRVKEEANRLEGCLWSVCSEVKSKLSRKTDDQYRKYFAGVTTLRYNICRRDCEFWRFADRAEKAFLKINSSSSHFRFRQPLNSLHSQGILLMARGCMSVISGHDHLLVKKFYNHGTGSIFPNIINHASCDLS